MKLVTYLDHGAEKVGALTADGTAVLPLPFPDMNTLIETVTLPDLRSAVSAAERGGASVPLTAVTLCAPIPQPRQDIVCLGMNYKEHEAESAHYDAAAFTKEYPAAVYFSKRVSQAVAPDGDIQAHVGLVERLDYEVELGVILGKTAKDVPAGQAGEYVFGYTVINDVSARDLQTGHKQWYFGKSLDGFTPMGPCIVTADEFSFPPALEISSTVNGQLRQHANTASLITSIPAILEELTAGMTLLPGTIIATGTPAGVGLGFDPPQFMKPGDHVVCEIEGIGALRNTVR